MAALPEYNGLIRAAFFFCFRRRCKQQKKRKRTLDMACDKKTKNGTCIQYTKVLMLSPLERNEATAWLQSALIRYNINCCCCCIYWYVQQFDMTAASQQYHERLHAFKFICRRCWNWFDFFWRGYGRKNENKIGLSPLAP